jgi:hypothetical protein
MAAWTKADYDAAYSFRVERYFGGHPSRAGRPEIRLNYHEFSMKPILEERWRRTTLILAPAIDATDRVLVIGAGFGWGVAAIERRSGATVVGIDTSPYIQAEKGADDSVEVAAAITAVGLDPLTGRGLFIMNNVKTAGPRAKVTILDEDMASPASRQRIGTALGGGPTWIVIEDIVDDAMTDTEIITLAGQLDQSSGNKVWLYMPTAARTSEQLNVLTGHKVIEFGTYRLVG